MRRFEAGEGLLINLVRLVRSENYGLIQDVHRNVSHLLVPSAISVNCDERDGRASKEVDGWRQT